MAEQQPAPTGEEELPAELEEKLPFPTARVVRIIKENLTKEHQLKSEVKIAANKLLGQILSDIARQMDKEEFYTLSIEHFNSAARKYREVDLSRKRTDRIKQLLLKQKAELEETVMGIEIAESEGV